MPSQLLTPVYDVLFCQQAPQPASPEAVDTITVLQDDTLVAESEAPCKPARGKRNTGLSWVSNKRQSRA